MGATTGGVEPTVYESIRDLPIRVWLDCIEKGVDNLVIDWNEIEDKAEWADWLKLKWQDIDDQIVDKFGLSEDKKEYIKTLNRYRIALAKSMVTRHPLDIHFVKHVEAELEALDIKAKNQPKTDFFDGKVALQEAFGYTISKETCVEEYFSMIKRLKEKSKAKA